ncbi:MAG: hypothetical protein JW726_14200 [Anaerolineales bacterium]|nr:hypothetical protein [Anaerolineales bacterium]
MNNVLILTLAALLVTITSLILLVSQDWRWVIATLAIQYLGVMVLVYSFWPLEMAIAKMIAGWMAGAVLGMAVTSTPNSWQEQERPWPSGRLFRLLAASLVIITFASFYRHGENWITPISPPALWGGLILIGMGLLHLGLTTQPLRVVIGLLTVLSGFEILYAAVETSSLVAGLLAGVHLGLALVGAYLIMAPEMEANA